MQSFHVDIQCPGAPRIVYAKQGDTVRKMQVSLYDGGAPYVPPSGTAAIVYYKGPSGQGTRAAQTAAEEAREQARAAEAAAPVILRPSKEQQEIQDEAAQRAEAHRIITPEGRLDFSQMNLQQFSQPAEEPMPYDFRAWLTKSDISALKQFFESRGIRYGKVK